MQNFSWQNKYNKIPRKIRAYYIEVLKFGKRSKSSFRLAQLILKIPVSLKWKFSSSFGCVEQL